MSQRQFSIGSIPVGNDLPFILIAGPCAIESEAHALETAHALHEMTSKLGIGFIYKSSFDKANRTSIKSPRGIGMKKGLEVLAAVKDKYGCPILTDIHAEEHCKPVAEVADVLQIPAFLCRQTDLLVAAAETGRALNVKKGQFLAPWDMRHVLNKCLEAGNERVMLCDRGTSFGYNTLVSDMRGLPIMTSFGNPVIFDATHSVQQPGGQGGTSGGQREFVPVLARAALSLGIAGVFMETHQNPDQAPSDGPNMIVLSQMPELLATLQKFDRMAKENPIRLPNAA